MILPLQKEALIHITFIINYLNAGTHRDEQMDEPSE